ncbi:unnamed protein product, partial [Rotaria sp. Silwood1]
MASSTSTPYEILGAHTTDKEHQLRVAFRARIHEYKRDRPKTPENHLITAVERKIINEKRKVIAEKFRPVFRAYETLSDKDKRQNYDVSGNWISDLPLQNYTLQQLAAEPE